MMDEGPDERAIHAALLLRMMGATWTEVVEAFSPLWPHPTRAMDDCLEFLMRKAEGDG